MDRNLALEVVRVTEAAALASARLMGRGDRNGADQAAVEAMRKAFNDIAIAGEVVIGEGERDEAPMLYIGEKVGRARAGDPEIEIAVDPLEGTNLCATGAPNAISVIAMGEKGTLLRAPDTYMEKIAVGPEARGSIDLARPPKENLRRVADALGKYVEDLTVVILDRPRHEKLVQEVRAAGARIKLIGDGDVAGALNTCFPDTGVDVLMGTGGAPEGVISAAALRCMGGGFQGRLAFRNEEEKQRAKAMGLEDLDKIFEIDELAGGNVMFAATGVTAGDFLKGVRFTGKGALTHSVVMRSRSGTLRYIQTEHRFEGKPDSGW
jgi:fructose-1,6-bisphosphatase II